MYKFEFTLKQHTPLIHFQHDQEGATLRATEVKPKLDFFIMKKLLNDPLIPDHKIREKFKEKALTKNPDNTDQLWKNWLIGKGDQASLDYKISIIGQPSTKYVIASKLSGKHRVAIGNSFKYLNESAFFAEEKSIGALFKPFIEGKKPSLKLNYLELLGDVSKQGIVNKDDDITENDIRIKIIAVNSDLRKEIKNNLISFFLSENFGCRQNKGFGCFSVNEIDGEIPPCQIAQTLTELFDYVYCKCYQDGFMDSLSVIQKDYKLLKAGRGRTEGYAKSKLFLYFAKKNIRWEKRWIKQEFYNNTTISRNFPFKLMVTRYVGNTEPFDINLKNDWKDINNPDNSLIEYKYIRALLGLAEQFEFQTDPKNIGKFVVQIGSENNPIQRYKSPITFKFINGNIYLLANKITTENAPLGENIDFAFGIKSQDHLIHEKTKHIIPNPPKIPSSFDIEEFIDFAISDHTDGASIGKYVKIHKTIISS